MTTYMQYMLPVPNEPVYVWATCREEAKLIFLKMGYTVTACAKVITPRDYDESPFCGKYRE